MNLSGNGKRSRLAMLFPCQEPSQQARASGTTSMAALTRSGARKASEIGKLPGWGLPPARTRRVSSIGAGLAPLSAPVNRLGASRHVKCVAAAKQRLHSRCLECPLDCGRLVGSCSADGVRHRQRGFIGEYRWVGVNPKCSGRKRQNPVCTGGQARAGAVRLWLIFRFYVVTTLPEEEQLMPLSRLNEGFEIELEGTAVRPLAKDRDHRRTQGATSTPVLEFMPWRA
jgi:hypothetical protein